MPASGSNLRFVFRPSWKVSVLTLVLFPCLMGLGFWQLLRAEEKRMIEQDYEARQSAPAIPFESLPKNQPIDYRQVILKGRFNNEQFWLLDNRIFRGRFGYEVIEPFELESGTIVLVNRGWVAADPARRTLPKVEKISGTQIVQARIKPVQNKPFGYERSSTEAAWPRVIQFADIKELQQQYSALVFSHVMWLDEASVGALQPNWQIVNVSPAKHQGYAVQWFSMAAALLLMYVLASSNLRYWLSSKFISK